MQNRRRPTSTMTKARFDKVLVVGASSGMGRLVAQRFIEAGCRVAVAARRTERLDDLVNMAPERVVAAKVDVTADDVAARINGLIDRLGGIDLYFHAAGIGYYNPELEANREDVTLATNALGFTSAVDAVFNRMAADGNGGHIAAITSIAQTKGIGAAPAYSATKRFQTTYLTALDQLSRSRRLGITFTDIRPGFVDTDFLRGDAYPMLMKPEKVADKAFKAAIKRRRVATIDWRYRLLVAAWRLIPRPLWVRLNIHRK